MHMRGMNFEPIIAPATPLSASVGQAAATWAMYVQWQRSHSTWTSMLLDYRTVMTIDSLPLHLRLSVFAKQASQTQGASALHSRCCQCISMTTMFLHMDPQFWLILSIQNLLQSSSFVPTR